MATIQGFEIETPQEVMARMQERIDQMRTSGDPNVVNAANSQQVITALFGTPETRAAQNTQDELTAALGSVSKRAEESEAEFQVRQQTAVRDKLAGVNPQVAVQANENIIRLQSEALEQRRLKVGIDTGELELKNALQTAVDSKTPVIFKRNAAGDTTAVGNLDPEATPEEIEAERSRFASADPSHTYVVGSGLDRLKLEDARFNKRGGLNNSTLADYEGALDETAALMFNGSSFMEQMIEAPLSLASTAESFATAGSFVQGARRIAGAFVNSDEEAESDLKLADQVMARSGFLEQAEDLGLESAVSRGLVLNMAYSLAKTLDPGGRLSDQDVEMAIQMLSGNGDPNALKKLLRARFEEAAFRAETHKTRALSGGLNGAVGTEKFNRYAEQRDRLFGLLDEFETVIDNGGLMQHHRGAFGKTRTAERNAGTPSDTTTAPKLKFTITPKG